MTSKGLEMDVTLEDLSDDEIAALKARGYARFQRLVRTDPGGAVYPSQYRELSQAYHNFQFKSDDIVVMSYPRSGSTWTREILWAMTNLDHLHLADTQHVNTRVFPIHYDMITPYHEFDISQFGGKTVMELANAQKSRRIIAAIMHFSDLHPNLLDTSKVVYVARNPKDVCLSTYNIYASLGRFTGDLSTWTELFTGGNIIYGAYWKHLEQAWRRRNHLNLHFMFYEDMKTDIMNELKKLNSFLKLGLSEEQLLRVQEHTQLENMKAREKKPIIKLKKGASFFNKAQVGGWNTAASPELDEYINAWITANSLNMDVPIRYRNTATTDKQQ